MARAKRRGMSGHPCPTPHSLLNGLCSWLWSNGTQCEALGCGYQSLQTNATASHVKQHLLKVFMANRVICLCPVQHHDDTTSVAINQAVDNHNVVFDVSAWDECMLWWWTQHGHWFPQPPCKHVGVDLAVHVQEHDGACVTDGSWLVLLGDEPHLSLLPPFPSPQNNPAFEKVVSLFMFIFMFWMVWSLPLKVPVNGRQSPLLLIPSGKNLTEDKSRSLLREISSGYDPPDACVIRFF